jgi:hypothetical protein
LGPARDRAVFAEDTVLAGGWIPGLRAEAEADNRSSWSAAKSTLSIPMTVSKVIVLIIVVSSGQQSNRLGAQMVTNDTKSRVPKVYFVGEAQNPNHPIILARSKPFARWHRVSRLRIFKARKSRP